MYPYKVLFDEFQVGETNIWDWKKIKNELYDREKIDNWALVYKNGTRDSHIRALKLALNFA